MYPVMVNRMELQVSDCSELTVASSHSSVSRYDVTETKIS